MMVVLDTNVFLQEKDRSCLRIVEILLETYPEYIQLALDADRTIEDEYDRYRTTMSLEGQELIQKVMDRIIDFSNFSPRFDAKPAPDHLGALERLKCHEPVQPALLCLTFAPTDPLLIYTANAREGITRAYSNPETLKELYSAGLVRNCLSADEAKALLSRHSERHPTTRQELEKLLDDHRVCGRREEHSFLECKGPRSVLTARMTKDIAKAVCAMLNTNGGWIFVGVRDSDKMVVGFEPCYENSTSRCGFERIQPIINQRINQIRPRPAGRFDPWVIDLKNRRVVIVIRVLKGKDGVTYCLDDGDGPVAYIRQGPESVRSDRACP
jgi:hypothetical protein